MFDASRSWPLLLGSWSNQRQLHDCISLLIQHKIDIRSKLESAVEPLFLFFDKVLKFLLLYRFYYAQIKFKLKNEANALKEKTSDDYYIKLLQINHQRVSGSISHISIMIAVLLFSYNSVFKDFGAPKLIIAIEVVLYLLLAVALVRCLRDFGLDDIYFPEQPDVESKNLWLDALLEELTFRYAILRFCNAAIITVTLTFTLLLGNHFLQEAMLSFFGKDSAR
jgi:hypothetical protein